MGVWEAVGYVVCYLVGRHLYLLAIIWILGKGLLRLGKILRWHIGDNFVSPQPFHLPTTLL